MADDSKHIYDDFKSLVNMTATQLERWLKSDDAQSVGIQKGTTTDKKTDAGGNESVGHESGRAIVGILRKRKTELTDADFSQMKRVVGYIKRHAAQRPSNGDVESSRWRYSLMIWGHDPLRG